MFLPRYLPSLMTRSATDLTELTPPDTMPDRPALMLPPSDRHPEAIQARFLEQYPRIHQLASFQHRRLHGDPRDEAIAETIARTWKAYLEKALSGLDPTLLLKSMVHYAALHVRAEKRIAGTYTGDVMSRANRTQHNYQIAQLPTSDDEETAGEVRKALRLRGTNPAEQAILNVDYEAFVATLTDKERGVMESLKAGLNLSDIARQRGISHAAVQDMRKTLARKWDEHFHDEPRSR